MSAAASSGTRPRPRRKKPRARRERPPGGGDGLARARAHGLALGYLATLPLLLAYESFPHGARNVAEAVISLPLAPLGASARWVRLGLLLAIAGLCLAQLFRASVASAIDGGVDAATNATAQRGLLQRLARIVLEGSVAALCLGPALLWLSAALGAEPLAAELAFPRGGPGPGLARAAFLAGGAAWEEILFRIGVQSLVLVLAWHLLAFLTENAWIVRGGSEVVAVLAGALVFSASHLATLTQVLGSGGEAFHAAVFTWRVAAGILLGALYRWRGAGVAAWAHALFNLFLSIGAGPDVFL